MPYSTQRDLIRQVLTIYSVKTIQLQLAGVSGREWSSKSLYQMASETDIPLCLTPAEVRQLGNMLPAPPDHHPHYEFRFIDLFAGIGGIRQGFDAIGGPCSFRCCMTTAAINSSGLSESIYVAVPYDSTKY